MNPPVAMSVSRILIVDGDSRVADGVERVLRHDLPGGASLVRAHEIPDRTDAFDAVVVVAGPGSELPSELPDLPVIVVDPAASAGACADRVRGGVEQALSARCATCSRQPALATTVLCAIERFRRARRVEEARRRERRAALHDPLTGLPNVRLYRERLRQLLAQGRRTGKRSALLFLDLDRFKEVNDTVGHARGDRLLRRVAARIRACIRETDTVARRGGDEFVVLLDDVREPADAFAVANGILSRISRTTAVLGAAVRPSASIGIAVFPEDGTTAAALEAEADRAMYRAKELGGNVAVQARAPDYALRSAGPCTLADPRKSRAALSSLSMSSLASARRSQDAGSPDHDRPSSTPLIETQDVWRVFRAGDVEVPALRGVSLRIVPGEFVVIMGASGSGKSTLLAILGGLDRPTRGRYLLDGLDLATLSNRELANVRNRRIGFVFQSFNLLARTSALENVELPLLYDRESSEPERRALAMEALDRVGLTDRVHHLPGQLSGGQQQRVAIARALVHRPAILFADEPTGNLDSKVSAGIMALLQNLNEAGLTIVMVTHEADVARYGKRRIHLRDGVVESDEPILDRTIAPEPASAGGADPSARRR